MKRIYILFLLLIPLVGYAQHTKQLLLQVDNDLFAFSDRNYTSGLFIGYQKELSESLIFNKTEKNKLQFSILLGQEIYAPEELDSFIQEKLDRPFAGWLYTNIGITQITTNTNLKISLDIGVTGKYSLAKELQQWYHKLLNIDIPSYAYQIPSELMGNLKANYLKEFLTRPQYSLGYESAISLGTKDIYGEQWGLITLGKKNDFFDSIRSGNIGSTEKESLLILGIGYRYVAHNALLEGSFLNDNAQFVKKALHNMFLAKMGVIWGNDKNKYEIYGRFNTKETRGVKHHVYVGLKYVRGL